MRALSDVLRTMPRTPHPGWGHGGLLAENRDAWEPNGHLSRVRHHDVPAREHSQFATDSCKVEHHFSGGAVTYKQESTPHRKQ